jgi:hypothetical protein
MAEDFLIETTNQRGIVTQKLVSVNQTGLRLANRSLVRVVGLERATTLQRLHVRRPNARIVGDESLTHSRSFRSVEPQLLRPRASVCARVDTPRRSLRESCSLLRCRC